MNERDQFLLVKGQWFYNFIYTETYIRSLPLQKGQVVEACSPSNSHVVYTQN